MLRIFRFYLGYKRNIYDSPAHNKYFLPHASSLGNLHPTLETGMAHKEACEASVIASTSPGVQEAEGPGLLMVKCSWG